MTHTLTTERLHEIASSPSFSANPLSHEVKYMARELLANREARPVGYIAEVSGNRVGVLRGLPLPDVGSLIYTAPPAPAVPAVPAVPDAISTRQAIANMERHELCGSINVAYKHGWNDFRAAMLAQPQIEPQNIPNNIPDGLAAAVNRLLDCDGTRGHFSATRCSDAREEVERLLTQPVSQGYKLNSPEIPDGWIACTEQTPDADGAYWCWFGKEEPSVIQQRVCIWINRNREWCDSAVTHWMPLPAAPIQGEKQ